MTKLQNEPRKRPTQDRARATFDAIVEAADRLLDHRSIEELTMQAIAELAGVSIGSLYQYFPTKEAVVATVIERDIDRVFRGMEALFRANAALPLDRLISVMVEALLANYSSRLAFYRTVLPEMNRLEREGAVRSASARAAELFLEAAKVRSHEVVIPEERREMAAFLIARVTNHMAHAAILERPDFLSSPRFAEELTLLTAGYLSRSARS